MHFSQFVLVLGWEHDGVSYYAFYDQKDYVRIESWSFSRFNAPSIDHVMNCLGEPDLYDFSLYHDPHMGTAITGEMWFLTKEIVVYFRNENVDKGFDTSSKVSMIDYSTFEDLDSFASRIWGDGPRADRPAYWLAKLQPWPADLEDLLIEPEEP